MNTQSQTLELDELELPFAVDYISHKLELAKKYIAAGDMNQLAACFRNIARRATSVAEDVASINGELK